MIGLGTWKGSVNTMFFKGDVTIVVKDNNGQYDFDVVLPADIGDIPEFKIYDVAADGNVITGKAEVSLLPGKVIDLYFEVDEDAGLMSGYLKVPFIGKIKIKDAQRIAK